MLTDNTKSLKTGKERVRIHVNGHMAIDTIVNELLAPITKLNSSNLFIKIKSIIFLKY